MIAKKSTENVGKVTKTKKKPRKSTGNSSFTLKVTNEEKRLRTAFGTLRIDQEILVDGLIRRAAFMRVQLEELERDLTVNGLTEEFTQSASAPSYDRERPAAKQYHSLNTNYQKIMRQLTDLLPKAINDGVPTNTENTDDGMDKFLERSER